MAAANSIQSGRYNLNRMPLTPTLHKGKVFGYSHKRRKERRLCAINPLSHSLPLLLSFAFFHFACAFNYGQHTRNYFGDYLYYYFIRWIQAFGEEGMNLLLKHLREHRVKYVLDISTYFYFFLVNNLVIYYQTTDTKKCTVLSINIQYYQSIYSTINQYTVLSNRDEYIAFCLVELAQHTIKFNMKLSSA
jgi:hypothetical protein